MIICPRLTEVDEERPSTSWTNSDDGPLKIKRRRRMVENGQNSVRRGLVLARSKPDSNLERVWTKLKNIFEILSRPNTD